MAQIAMTIIAIAEISINLLLIFFFIPSPSYVDGNLCELTYKEFELFKYLVINKGIVLSRDKIMNQVWGFDYEGESRTVDMHIKTLRQKLGEAGSHIKTVRNVGYMVE